MANDNPISNLYLTILLQSVWYSGLMGDAIGFPVGINSLGAELATTIRPHVLDPIPAIKMLLWADMVGLKLVWNLWIEFEQIGLSEYSFVISHDHGIVTTPKGFWKETI